jgi:hypothetical protein
MRYLLDPITGPYPSDNAGRTCLLWLGGPCRPAGLRCNPEVENEAAARKSSEPAMRGGLLGVRGERVRFRGGEDPESFFGPAKRKPEPRVDCRVSIKMPRQCPERVDLFRDCLVRELSAYLHLSGLKPSRLALILGEGHKTPSDLR